jgi:hypothetical protein
VRFDAGADDTFIELLECLSLNRIADQIREA